jgi:hypothetical protein
LIRYPEVLAWQALWQQTRERMFHEIYGVAKALAPDRQVAFNVHATPPELRAAYRHRLGRLLLLPFWTHVDHEVLVHERGAERLGR